MLNRALFNPAAIGIDPGHGYAFFTYRQQWFAYNQVPGPRTMAFNTNFPFGINKNNKLEEPWGAGLTMISDRLGNEERLQFNGALARHVTLRGNQQPRNGFKTLFFGINFGLIQYGLVNDFDPKHVTDPTLTQAAKNFIVPDLGAGLMLKNDRSEIGISASHLTESKIKYSPVLIGLQSRHYYAYVRHHFQGDDSKIRISPSVMFKYVSGQVPYQLEANLRIGSVNNDAWWCAASYRHEDAVVIMAGLNFGKSSDHNADDKNRSITNGRGRGTNNHKADIDKKRQIALAYDYPISSLSSVVGGSVELVLIYNFNVHGVFKPKTP